MDPESQTCEWKKSLQLKEEALAALCGMLNARKAKGKVIFGVDPHGVEVGLDPGNLDKAQRSLAQLIEHKFQPPIQSEMDVIEKDGKRFLILSAERNKRVAYHEMGGRAYLRVGTITRQLSLSEKRNLRRYRGGAFKIVLTLVLVIFLASSWFFVSIFYVPFVRVGLVLGADKGIGHDAVIDCSKPLYMCLTENEAKTAKPLTLDVGTKGWARIVYRIENLGRAKARNTSVHIDNADPISIEFAPKPDPTRMPRNVLDVVGGDIQPHQIAKGAYEVPLDVTVPHGLDEIGINFKVFGDNLTAHELNLKFKVKR